MTQRTKLISLIFLVGALVSLVLLAGSLPNLQFQSGSSLASGDNSNNAVYVIETLPAILSYPIPILQGIIAFIFIVFMIYVPARIITSGNIKFILLAVLFLVILLIAAYLIPRIHLGQLTTSLDGSPTIISPPKFTYPVVPLGDPPQILIWLVIFGFILGISLPVIKIVKQWLDPSRIEDELLQEAEDAVNAIEAGMNLRNVIMRCYMQMTRSLQEEQGIQRNYTMTVREFEEWLKSMGFPIVPVHQLTTLFEKVRYGEQPIGENDEKIAVESLNKIIEFCQKERVQTNG